MPVDLPFEYRIRRSQRATGARIVVKPGQVEVVAPWQIPDHKLHKFVQAKQNWVTQALRKMAAASSLHAEFAPREYQSGVNMNYLGVSYPLTVLPTSRKRVKVEFNDAFIVFMPDSIDAQDQSRQIKAAMIVWLKKQTKLLVEQVVSHHAGKQQLIPRSISIKTQKSRWGSCGIHNDININWLLTLAPKEVLEYVVVHELCHIREKNHSDRFWSLVGEHLPDFRQRRHWLKKHGRSLMLSFTDS